jgi:hypothetical protein
VRREAKMSDFRRLTNTATETRAKRGEAKC